MLGVATWFGAIGAGFAQTNVRWGTYDSMLGQVEVKTARPEVEEAETDGKSPRPFLDIVLMRPGENDADKNKEPVYPEEAKPITSDDGRMCTSPVSASTNCR